MGYKPKGQGVLVSFDASWRKSDNPRIKDGKLRKDFENMIKGDLEQQYPDMYIEAFPYGENAAAHSLYFEMKGQGNLNEMVEVCTPYQVYHALAWDSLSTTIRVRFYDYLGAGTRPMHVSNFQVSDAELANLRKAGK